jgi:4-hydroxybenzoate polyprenyltransferase
MSSITVMFYKDSKIVNGYFNEINLYYWLIIPLALLNLYQIYSKWTRDGRFSNNCFLNSAFVVISIMVGIVLI